MPTAIEISQILAPASSRRSAVQRSIFCDWRCSAAKEERLKAIVDIWASTRASTSDPWGPPMNLGPVINTVGLETVGLERRPALSFDGRSLYFFSNGHGGSGLTDPFVSTRTRRDGFDDVTTMTDLPRRRDET